MLIDNEITIRINRKEFAILVKVLQSVDASKVSSLSADEVEFFEKITMPDMSRIKV